MKDHLQLKSTEMNPIHLINAIFISIVLFLHHHSYANNYFSLLAEYKINLLLQKFAVGGFFFFSGLKLSLSNYKIVSTKFWKKKFLRIYILYLLAIIIASFSSYPFMKNSYPSFLILLKHIFLVQTVLPTLWGRNFHTLWFVSILFFCYILFQSSKKDLPQKTKFIMKQCIVFIGCSIAYLTTKDSNFIIMDRDFAIYLMFFSIGMLSSRFEIKSVNFYIYLLVGIISNILILVLYNTIYVNTWYEYTIYALLIIVSNLPLFCLLCRISKKNNLPQSAQKYIQKYSFASFCIFLFHRSIWTFMTIVFPKGTFVQWCYIVLLGIPVIVLCSYIIQYYFNYLLLVCANKRKDTVG